MNDSGIQVIDRGIELLSLLATSENGLSIAQLSEKTNLPKSTVHRILSSLASHHYVQKDADTSIYHLGYVFVELASIYLNKLVLRTEAVPFMHEAANAFGVTAYLGVIESDQVMYLESIEQFSSLRLYTQIGKREPLYCTALGKVLTAAKTKDERIKIANALEYRAYTNKSIVNANGFLSELENVAAKGYAVDLCEHTEDSSCLAVPVYDYTGSVMAAMSISGPRLFERFEENYIYSVMLDISLRLSARMGYITKS